MSSTASRFGHSRDAIRCSYGLERRGEAHSGEDWEHSCKRTNNPVYKKLASASSNQDPSSGLAHPPRQPVCLHEYNRTCPKLVNRYLELSY